LVIGIPNKNKTWISERRNFTACAIARTIIYDDYLVANRQLRQYGAQLLGDVTLTLVGGNTN
jgi:hypothetical protein